MELLQLLISKSDKPILPTIVIATHGGYTFTEHVTKNGIDRVDDIHIEMKKLPEGMKLYKLETAPIGVMNYLYESDVNHVCGNIQKYMRDQRTIELLVKDLVEITDKKNEEAIETDSKIKLDEQFVKKFRREQMNTFQIIDGSQGQSYYEKSFSRNLHGEDRIGFYDKKINLILPENNVLSKITRWVFPKTIDIYDNVIEYQDKNGYIYYPKYNEEEDIDQDNKQVFLSGIINYMNDILKIKEFIIVDLTCSVFRFVDHDGIIYHDRIFRHDNKIAENTRVIRQSVRGLVTANKAKSYIVTRKDKLALPNGSYTKKYKKKGGKRTISTNFRNKSNIIRKNKNEK